MINLYDYSEGINNKEIVASFVKDENGSIVIDKPKRKKKTSMNLWGYSSYTTDYVNRMTVRLNRHWPTIPQKPEYRYVYNFTGWNTRSPIACLVRVGDSFGLSVVSDRTDTVYYQKFVSALDMLKYHFKNGEQLVSVVVENGDIKGFNLSTPRRHTHDNFSYSTARSVAISNIGKTNAPHRLVETYNDYVLLQDIVNEMMENWYSV